MKRILVVSMVCAALLGLAAPSYANEAGDTITIEWDGAPLDCVEDHAVKHINDVLSSPNYYIVHYPPYGIFWIVGGTQDSIRCLLPPN